MDTVVALLSAVARALRGLFDMALMAVGVAPTSIPVTDAALLPMDMDEAVPRPAAGVNVNPSTGYIQLLGPDLPDIRGVMPGRSVLDVSHSSFE